MPFPQGVGPTASLGAGHGALDSHPPVPIGLRRDLSPRHSTPFGLEISSPHLHSPFVSECAAFPSWGLRGSHACLLSAPGILCPHLDFLAWSFLPVSPNTCPQHSRHFTTLPYPFPLAAHSPPPAATSSPLCTSSSSFNGTSAVKPSLIFFGSSGPALCLRPGVKLSVTEP